MHAKASIDATTLAETETYEFVEGNVYFSPSSLADKEKVFTLSSHRTYCPWKGEAHYYDVNANGRVIANGAWYYPAPLENATHIKDHVAFYKSKIQVDKE